MYIAECRTCGKIFRSTKKPKICIGRNCGSTNLKIKVYEKHRSKSEYLQK